MMSLQNKMVKPFGGQMCYKTFWAPILIPPHWFGPHSYIDHTTPVYAAIQKATFSTIHTQSPPHSASPHYAQRRKHNLINQSLQSQTNLPLKICRYMKMASYSNQWKLESRPLHGNVLLNITGTFINGTFLNIMIFYRRDHRISSDNII